MEPSWGPARFETHAHTSLTVLSLVLWCVPEKACNATLRVATGS